MGYYWAFLLLPAFFGCSSGNCGVPPRLEYGALDPLYFEQDNFSVDATVNYTCRPGFITVSGTSNVITCLSSSSWSTPEVFCKRRPCGNPGDIENGQMSIDGDPVFGSRVNYTCNVGYVMISKRDYRECLADGTWSNEVPVCEVQTCPPPPAITDGSYDPDLEEYDYQHSVTYRCINKSLSLIGEKSMYCTAYGNWSLDPPKCIEVLCKSPDVENSEKLSGFNGPYTLDSAVRFQCLSGYTMTGESSVKCNASSEWDPPLPTCSKIVTQTTTTTTTTTTTITKDKETESGGTTVSQNPSTTKKKDETDGGSTVSQKTTKEPNGSTVSQKTTKEPNGEGSSGAIVGGVIGGIFGILIAASIIFAFWFRRKKGLCSTDYIAATQKKPDSEPSSSPQTALGQYDLKQLEAQVDRHGLRTRPHRDLRSVSQACYASLSVVLPFVY